MTINALVDGFDTGFFGLDPDSDGSRTAFAFQAPPDAVIVTCALFLCEPEIGDLPGGFGTLGIVNYDECVHATAQFPGAQGVFALSGRTRAFSPDAGCEAEAPPSSPRSITRALVGCWAYDETHIVAATDLEPVDLRATAFASLVADCHDEGTSRESCLLDDAGTFGTCFAQECRRRCIDPQECDDPDGGAPVRSSDCLRVDQEYVGACVPRDAGGGQ